ncbi:DUF1643 domain-containing protein [Lactiplantibacillus paraplantarum]|uniref:DUF1643 domain-containing protein n=1 Tax=Lactiplantibacillus paraplantarum TaxID=60520 RepID=UPI0023AA2351|nr:DUF1643 domain-containing protein [Lactiplantibacillus paraplantarum]WEE36054.1 DUF1643 domain-containing protein [Lactiplantibacillus paraplantarum]
MLVVTNYPGISNGLVSDLTTSLVINNVAEKFGSVELVNLFSLVGGLKNQATYETGFTKVTDQVTLLEANKADVIVIATGSYGLNDKYGKVRQLELLKQLTSSGLEAKIQWLVNNEGKPAHPLSMRHEWKVDSKKQYNSFDTIITEIIVN